MFQTGFACDAFSRRYCIAATNRRPRVWQTARRRNIKKYRETDVFAIIIAMTDTTPPLATGADSRPNEMSPTLTASQIARIAAHGQARRVHSGEVLVEAGELTQGAARMKGS